MNFLVMALVLAFTMPEAQAQTKSPKESSLIDRFFKPKPKPTPRPRAKRKTVAKPKQKEPEKKKVSDDKPPIFIVDNEWIAHYKILEDAFGYSIPEDKDIVFKDGKHYVPVVVYRHYEDMMKTPRKE